MPIQGRPKNPKREKSILKGNGWSLFGLILGLILPAYPSLGESLRMEHRLGAHLGYLAEPFPSSFSANLNLNLTDWLRIHGGAGFITSKIQTYGGGFKLLVPEWNFSPMAGISLAKLAGLNGKKARLSGPLGPLFKPLGPFPNGLNPYVSAGLDWQFKNGAYFSLGYHYSLIPGSRGWPFLQFGWFLETS